VQDYYNCRVRDFVKVREDVTRIDRQTTPRMPWHDVHSMVIGLPAADIARHFIQRWNFARLGKRKSTALVPMVVPTELYQAALLEAASESMAEPLGSALPHSDASRPASPMHHSSHIGRTQSVGGRRQSTMPHKSSAIRGGSAVHKYRWEGTQADLIHAMRGGSAVSGIRSSPIPVQCQILRSVGPWSSGRKEASIHTAYCDIIQRAERFIVIEQQFLISGASGDDQVLTVPPILLPSPLVVIALAHPKPNPPESRLRVAAYSPSAVASAGEEPRRRRAGPARRARAH
jgi:phospholipase D1/2